MPSFFFLLRMHPSKRCSRFIISIVPSSIAFRKLLSFLVSGFVKLCQNGGCSVKRVRNENRPILFIFARIISFPSFFFFLFCIRFASNEGERIERVHALLLLLFICSRTSRFSNRIFSVRKIVVEKEQ